jgi:excisionase family DNA binding protein
MADHWRHMQTATHPPVSFGVDQDPWLNLQQAAVRVGCNEATLRRLIRGGLLRHARIGLGRKHIRLKASWVDACLEGCAAPIELR